MSESWMTTKEAATKLGVSIGTVRRWADCGYLKHSRTPGGQRRFSQGQVQELINRMAAKERFPR